MSDPTQTESVTQIPDPGWFTECADSVAQAWHTYRDATDPISQACALVALNDRISDLRTYLPGYDYETGTLPWERDEEVIDDEDGQPSAMYPVEHHEDWDTV